MPQQLSLASRQLQAHRYKNIHIKGGRAGAPRVERMVPRDLCPAEGKPDKKKKKKEAGKGSGEIFRGKKSPGRAGGGTGQPGSSPCHFQVREPPFSAHPIFPCSGPLGPGLGASLRSSSQGPLARDGPEASAGDHSKVKVCPSAPTGKRREIQETEEAETERQRGRDRGRRERLRQRRLRRRELESDQGRR